MVPEDGGIVCGVGRKAGGGVTKGDLGFAARCLLRAARVGTLATARDGQPHAALVTPALAADGAVLLLLSGLSAHTRQLRDDPRCAVLVSGLPEGVNPQTAPRLCVQGRASVTSDTALRGHFLAHHPYAAQYAGFADFTLWRVAPAAAQYVAGFGRAHRLASAAFLPVESAVRAVAKAAPALIECCNRDHREALSGVARGAGGSGGWELRCLDIDGALLGQGEAVLRVAFDAPVGDEPGLRAALARMLKTASGPI